MKKDRNTSAEAAELRRRAEARLRLRAAATKGAPARTEADTQRLVHELQVHQIELEMQNEELRESRAEVEAGLERYTELYDFAPVGYLTLGRDGAIRQVNLTGARLLGVERARLVGRRFGVFVGAPDRAGFKAFLEKVFASQAKEVCEVALLKDGKGPPNVHITATVSQDGQECRVMLADITERKQAAAEMKRLASFPMLNPRPIVEVDVAGHVHFCNPTATQMFPDLFQRGLGHPWLAGWEAVLRNLRKDGLNPIAREVYFDEKWYHQTIHFVDDAQRIRIYGADITARKKIEEALQKAHDELEEQVEERTVELRAALSEIKTMKDQLEAENIYFREETKLKGQFGNIIGQSDGLKYVLYRAEQVAPANTTILILGETGTGKELIAAAIHNMSPRKDRPLITVNCAALPANLIESELFGREKGAFTGADARRVGRFEVAHGSTLCLDEIGELPLELQAKLLRVIQHGEFERLGSSHTLKVDVRIVATTNRDLEEEVRKGRFRQDLYYRLNVFPITVPPLRQRTGDIPLLVEAFIARYSRKLGKQITSIQKETMKTLQEYPWPGNVRELESVLERAVILCPGPVLHLTDKLEISSLPMSSAIRTLEEVERNQIRKILKETRWRIEGKDGTAAILGLHPSTLRARMHKLGILRPKANASG
jgi:formate hydrogenlyase transcriptional activator